MTRDQISGLIILVFVGLFWLNMSTVKPYLDLRPHRYGIAGHVERFPWGHPEDTVIEELKNSISKISVSNIFKSTDVPGRVIRYNKRQVLGRETEITLFFHPRHGLVKRALSIPIRKGNYCKKLIQNFTQHLKQFFSSEIGKIHVQTQKQDGGFCDSTRRKGGRTIRRLAGEGDTVIKIVLSARSTGQLTVLLEAPKYKRWMSTINKAQS